jgi:hypothetical protein
MTTGDITLVYKTLLGLNVNQGLIMKSNEQSIAILKREDTKGIYYSIKEFGSNTQYDDSDAMMLLLLNNTTVNNYSQN